MIIQIWVGSACHLKGSPDIIELLTQAIKENELDDRVTLKGSFCMGKCSTAGVTVKVDEEIHVGVSVESFREFFNENILSKFQIEGM